MGTVAVLLLLVSSVAIATSVVTYIIVNRRKRQQAQIAAEKLQRESQEAQRKAEQERQRREAEEAQRKAEQERLRGEAEEAERKAEEEGQRLVAEEAQRKAEEDRQRREEEEVERKAEEDRRRREAEEVQRKPGEDRQRREAEGRRQKTEAERQRREADEELRKAKEERERQEERRRRQVPLDHRPPRRRTEGDEKHLSGEIIPRRPKPEVVCWQRERRWILAVEMPEDLWEKPELAVHQNASPLAQDEREGRWRLDQVCGQVTVHWNEDEAPQEAKITLGEENCILFKLSGQDQKLGCRVKSPSSGSYFVVVAESWERDKKFSGSPPASPEPVSVEGCQGHFFDLEKGGDKRIAFRTSEGKSILIESKAARFELVGNQLSDASEGIGPLFGQSAPQIRASQDRVWADIRTVIIGEEGNGRGKWRKSFSPAPEGREQSLPAEAAPRKDGWYFLRFYDMGDDLVESLDFRLVSALREIKILQPSPFPSEGEHGPVYIEFTHESDCAIQPTDDLARCVQIESKNNKTILTIPPEPIYDETRWRVGSEGEPQVITVLVERLWWAVSPENDPPCEWKDDLLTLARNDFVPTSKKALWLRLPRQRWADKVLVGFEQSRAQACPVKIAEETIAKPLRDFGDYREMREVDRDHLLSIWIQRDKELVQGIVAIIPASKGPVLCIEHGKKKMAIATAILRKGTGAIAVNGRPVEDYFERAPLRAKQLLLRLLKLPYVSKELAQMEVSIEVSGSNPGTVQQAKASAHALARALMRYDPKLKSLLRRQGFGGVKVKKISGVH